MAEPFERVYIRRTLSGLKMRLIPIPGFSLRSNPGLKLANAFGVFFQTEPVPQLVGAFAKGAHFANAAKVDFSAG